MFDYHCKVRMYDTDMAGILYFGNQYRFMHDAFESLMAKEGYTFQRLMQKEDFMFVIVHAETDYLAPLYAGDSLTVKIHVSHIGTTSFHISYSIYKADKLAGKGKTIHVCLDKNERTKKSIPNNIQAILQNYRVN